LGGARFDAPWGKLLTGITLVSSVILIGLPIVGLTTGPVGTWPWSLLMVALPLGLLAGCALFMLRGYEISPEGLMVLRAGWQTRIPLSGLQSVTVMPDAMRGSLRTFGNGGLFCFAGKYWSRKLGHFRAFVTDLNRTVVLRFTDGRTIVVSPSDPETFVGMIRTVTGVTG